MTFSFIANVTKNLELGYLKECKCTRVMRIKSEDVKILSYPEKTREQKEKDLKESKRIERGANGEKVKDHFNDECQVCKAQGVIENSSFIKENGSRYSEAHHVIPLSENGTDFTDNIMCLCATHHRQMHYGDVKVNFDHYNFHVTLDEKTLPRIPRWGGE
jgi:predicted restriction endonuclease